MVVFRSALIRFGRRGLLAAANFDARFLVGVSDFGSVRRSFLVRHWKTFSGKGCARSEKSGRRSCSGEHGAPGKIGECEHRREAADDRQIRQVVGGVGD